MITSAAIASYARFPDRADHYDDTRELRQFLPYLHLRVPDASLVVKPAGPYGVDLGVAAPDGTWVAFFELERCRSWDDDWPAHWQSLSFLQRKDRYLSLPEFHMVWFNRAVTKCVIARGDDIAACVPSVRTFAGQSQTDRVRRVPFDCGVLVGTDFQPRECARFSTRVTYVFGGASVSGVSDA